MNSGSNIFDKVRQKVEIFSSKSTTRYFSAEQKPKQFFASSFQVIKFSTIAIKFRPLAEACLVIEDTFRRRAASTIQRATLAIGRAVSTMCRVSFARQRAEAAIRRAVSAIRRVNSAMQRAISAMWRADLTKRRAIPANQFRGVNAWYYPFFSKNGLNERSAIMAHRFLLAVILSLFLPMSFLRMQAPTSLFKGNM
ncbi:MAG: hypothetical protein COZ25_02680 [Ignavibacteria bacterium CG_4_10_14_3_um_filter_37_18]|nr:hypothetical protein [Ignavibacteria bacterium]PIX94997.1 MAG: hypothetical protein COZ25_02680 [Ignavibacteria bacterium CG_4_10_14_3_um_filter_37_18]